MDLQARRSGSGRSRVRETTIGLWRVVLLGLLIASFQSGCRTPAPPEPTVEPYRVSDFLNRGDPARRASLRLVVQGLEADQAGNFASARAGYERAIQVDATDPWAYLALARYYLEQGEPERVSALLDQSAALFEAEGLREPRVGVHLIGLRGGVFAGMGREADATLYLERAETLAPGVWGDGQLEAGELL